MANNDMAFNVVGLLLLIVRVGDYSGSRRRKALREISFVIERSGSFVRLGVLFYC